MALAATLTTVGCKLKIPNLNELGEGVAGSPSESDEPAMDDAGVIYDEPPANPIDEPPANPIDEPPANPIDEPPANPIGEPPANPIEEPEQVDARDRAD